MRSERGASTTRVASAHRRGRALALMFALALAGPAPAQDRTPLGAEVSGNAAGTIPSWQGGLKSPVAGHAQILVVPDLESGNMLEYP